MRGFLGHLGFLKIVLLVRKVTMKHLYFVNAKGDTFGRVAVRLLEGHFNTKPFRRIETLPEFFVAVFTLHKNPKNCCLCTTSYAIEKNRVPKWAKKTVFYFGLCGDPFYYQDMVLEKAIHLNQWIRREREDLPWYDNSNIEEMVLSCWLTQATRLREQFHLS
jgi:hypothetical protein